jgi:hypothetical protein
LIPKELKKKTFEKKLKAPHKVYKIASYSLAHVSCFIYWCLIFPENRSTKHPGINRLFVI